MSNYKLNHSRVLDNSCTEKRFNDELYELKGTPTYKQKKFFWRLYYILSNNNIKPKREFVNSRGLLSIRIDILKEQCINNNLL